MQVKKLKFIHFDVKCFHDYPTLQLVLADAEDI